MGEKNHKKPKTNEYIFHTQLLNDRIAQHFNMSWHEVTQLNYRTYHSMARYLDKLENLKKKKR